MFPFRSYSPKPDRWLVKYKWNGFRGSIVVSMWLKSDAMNVAKATLPRDAKITGISKI